MAAGLLIFPGAQPSRSRQGTVISAELRWYENETTTPAIVYTDAALTVPHQFPIVSDDAGRFPLIYADQTDVFSCAWSTAAPDSQVQSYDFITPSTAEDVVLLDEMNAVLSDAMDLYESLEDVQEAVLEAQGYAAEAAEAATGAPGTNATSTTSLTVGTGTKSLTVEPNKLYVVGMTVTIASTASPTNAMSGQVTSYNTSTGALVVDVQNYSGSGTLAAWTVSLSALAQTIKLLRQARTSDTTLIAGDARSWIDVTSGTFTQTLTAAGTLGDGWWVDYGNSGTGTVTIDPAGTELIGGSSTLSVLPGELFRIQCDGSAFNVQVIKSDLGPHVIVQEQTASAADSSSPTTTSAYNTRILNTVVRNVGGATLNSNQVTLPAGTWRLKASAPGYGLGGTRVRIRNVTDSTTTALGESQLLENYGSSIVQFGTSVALGVVTLTSPKAFEVQQFISLFSSGSYVGRATTSGEVNVYAVFEATRIS